MLRVLIAEDDALNLNMLTRIMEHLGFEVISAGTGEQAVRQFRGQHIDLVLMDIQMPEMDGIEATIQIRRLEERALVKATGQIGPTPIIAVTANIDPYTRRRCLEVGMTEYLNKPIRKQTIELLLTQLFPRWRPRAPLNRRPTQ
ncbi:MAG: response regulator [Bradymonadia bacterium]